MCTYIYILPFENWSEHFPFSPSDKSGLPHKYLWNTYAYSAGQSIAESKPKFFDLACGGGGGCEGSFGIRSILGQRNPIFVASLIRHNFPLLCNASLWWQFIFFQHLSHLKRSYPVWLGLSLMQCDPYSLCRALLFHSCSFRRIS